MKWNTCFTKAEQKRGEGARFTDCPKHVWDTIDEDDFVEEESTTIQVKRAQNFAFPDFLLFSDDCFDDFFRTLLFPSEMISVVMETTWSAFTAQINGDTTITMMSWWKASLTNARKSNPSRRSLPRFLNQTDSNHVKFTQESCTGWCWSPRHQPHQRDKGTNLFGRGKPQPDMKRMGEFWRWHPRKLPARCGARRVLSYCVSRDYDYEKCLPNRFKKKGSTRKPPY